MNRSTLEHAFDPITSFATTASPQPTIGETELYLISTAFGTTWIFGLVSNIIALMAISRMKQTPLNVFIIGLCCSDILSILASPFVIAQIVYSALRKDYPWNRAICKAVYPILTVTPAVTANLVLALSIWRIYAIHRPHRASKVMTLKRAKRIMMAVWVASIIVIVPAPVYSLTVRYSRYSTKMICYFGAQHKWITVVYNIVDAVVTTTVPVALIVILCVAIGLSLLVQKSKRQKLSGNHGLRQEEKNALLQLALIVTSFLFGYVPKICYFAFNLVSDYQFVRFHTVIFLTSRFLLSFTEFVNTIVYNLGSKSIRESTKRTLQSIFCINQPPNENSGQQQPTKDENIEMDGHNGVQQGSEQKVS